MGNHVTKVHQDLQSSLLIDCVTQHKEVVFAVLSLEQFITLSEVSKVLQCIIKPILQQEYVFVIPKSKKISYYSPQHVKVISPSSIPTSATKVTIMYSLNSTIKFSYSSSITHLEYDNDKIYRKKVPSLPPALKTLILGGFFMTRQNINNIILPSSLTKLVLKNGPVPNLPPSLTYLDIGKNCIFDQELPHSLSTFIYNGSWSISKLPPSLTTLRVLSGFSSSIHFSLIPPSLTDLSYPFSASSITSYGECLSHSHSLISLSTDAVIPVNNLPPSLTSLSIHRMDNEFGTLYFSQPLDSLPSTLRYLTIKSDHFNESLDSLPPSLTYLHLSSTRFAKSIDNLPHSLTELSLEYINIPVDNLPPSLTKLSLRFHFNNPINHLPSSLLHLNIQGDFGHPLNKLPRSLQTLTIYSTYFNQHLYNLPPSLTEFVFSSESQTFPIQSLPSSLTYLYLRQLKPRIIDLPPNLLYLRLSAWDRVMPVAFPPLPSKLKEIKIFGTKKFVKELISKHLRNAPKSVRIINHWRLGV